MKLMYAPILILITLNLLLGNERSYTHNDYSTQAQATATDSENPPPERGSGR